KMLGENNALVAGGQGSPKQSYQAAHTVRAGDTLYGIVRTRLAAMGMEANGKASMQGVKQLAQANHIRNPDRIYIGQKLDLAALDALLAQKASPTGSINRSTIAANGIEQPNPRYWEDPVSESDVQLAAEEDPATPMVVAPAPMPPIAAN